MTYIFTFVIENCRLFNVYFISKWKEIQTLNDVYPFDKLITLLIEYNSCRNSQICLDLEFEIGIHLFNTYFGNSSSSIKNSGELPK